MRIPTQHPSLPWLFRHTLWLRDRFLVDQRDQRTAYQRQVPETASTVLQCGECVLWEDPHKQRFKYEANWGHGVYLGRSKDSKEHLVAARTAGVVRCRTVRRRLVEDQFDQQMLLAMQGTPWDAKGRVATGEQDVEGAQPRPEKRARGRPRKRLLLDISHPLYFAGCSACSGLSYQHSKGCMRLTSAVGTRERAFARTDVGHDSSDRSSYSGAANEQQAASGVASEQPAASGAVSGSGTACGSVPGTTSGSVPGTTSGSVPESAKDSTVRRAETLAEEDEAAHKYARLDDESDTIPMLWGGERLAADYYNLVDEDNGQPLDARKVAEGVHREMKFLDEQGLGEPYPRDKVPEKAVVWTARWVRRIKGDGV
eukprot:1568550-Amphidinium_carterae.3